MHKPTVGAISRSRLLIAYGVHPFRRRVAARRMGLNDINETCLHYVWISGIDSDYHLTNLVRPILDCGLNRVGFHSIAKFEKYLRNTQPLSSKNGLALIRSTQPTLLMLQLSILSCQRRHASIICFRVSGFSFAKSVDSVRSRSRS